MNYLICYKTLKICLCNTWYSEQISSGLRIKIKCKVDILKTIYNTKGTRTNVKKRWKIWFYWESSKVQMNKIGEPHIFHNLNLKQIKYVL